MIVGSCRAVVANIYAFVVQVEPGESLSDCDKDEDEESLEESKIDNEDDCEDGFFVPDGYLSENEVRNQNALKLPAFSWSSLWSFKEIFLLNIVLLKLPKVTQKYVYCLMHSGSTS